MHASNVKTAEKKQCVNDIFRNHITFHTQYSTLCEPNKCLCVYVRMCVMSFFAIFFRTEKLYNLHSTYSVCCDIHTRRALIRSFSFDKISIHTDLMYYGKCDETLAREKMSCEIGKCHSLWIHIWWAQNS